MRNTNLRHTKGFTLIELMIVIAILGILLAIAIPAYNDYLIRSKVSEGLMVASNAKVSVAEFIVSEKEMPSNADQAGFSTIVTSYVEGVSWTSNQIQVDINATNVGSSDDLTIVLTPNATTGTTAVEWECTATGAGARYAPSSCR